MTATRGEKFKRKLNTYFSPKQNMFLAIINDTYSEVKAEIAGKRNDFEIGDYLKRGYNNMLV